MNLSKIKKLFTKSYSFNLIFLMKNRFQDEKVRISPKKWTSKFENALFLLARQYSNLLDINFSSEYVDLIACFSCKNLLDFEGYMSKFS